MAEALERLESLSLTSFTRGDYLVISRQEFDLTLFDEPYIALMLLYNTKSGHFLARLWNKTVASGRAMTLDELSEVCEAHFSQGQLCLGCPESEEEQKENQFLVSQSPISRRISRACNGFVGNTSSNALACTDCRNIYGPLPLTIVSVESRLLQQPAHLSNKAEELQQRIDEVISQNMAIVGETQFDEAAADDEEVVMDETLDEDDAQDAYNQSIQSGPLSVWLGEENDRPPFTYKQLIGQALLTEKCSGLPLMDIYSFISKRYPYFKMKNPGWQNSIRHNLSLNKWFEMVPDSNEGRRGSCWRIKEGSKFEEVLSRKVGQRWIPKAPKSQQIPKCNVCNAVFNSLPMLYSHKRREGHINVPKSHKCPDCDSEYFTKSHLARHKRQCQIPSEVNESAVPNDLLTEDLSHS